MQSTMNFHDTHNGAIETINKRVPNLERLI